MSTTINNFTGPFDPVNWQVTVSNPSPQWLLSPTSFAQPSFLTWSPGNTSVVLSNTVSANVINSGSTLMSTRIMGPKQNSTTFTITFTAAFSPSGQTDFFYNLNFSQTPVSLVNGVNTVTVNISDILSIGFNVNVPVACSLTISDFSCSNFVYSESASLISIPYNSYNLNSSNNGAAWNPPSSDGPSVLLSVWEPNLQNVFGFYGGHLMQNSGFVSLPPISILQADYAENNPQPLALPVAFPNQQTSINTGSYFSFCQPQAPLGYVSLGNVNVGQNASGSLSNNAVMVSYLLNYRCVHASYTKVIDVQSLIPVCSVGPVANGYYYLNVWQLPVSGYFLFTVGAPGAYPTGQIRDLDPDRAVTNYMFNS